MSKKIVCCLAVLIMLVTCYGCKTAETFPVRDYLSLLAERAGLSNDNEDHLENLQKWGVVKQEEMTLLDDDLDLDYLALTIDRLIEGDNEDYFEAIKDRGWIKRNCKGSDPVSRENAEEVIDKAVSEINSREFAGSYVFSIAEDIKDLQDYSYYDGSLVTDEDLKPGEVVYLEKEGVYKKVGDGNDGVYVLSDAGFDEIFESIEMEDSYELDLTDSIDIPYGIPENGEVIYENLDKKLLSSSIREKTFTVNGFRVSYSIKTNSIDAHISKNINGINAFFDLSISSIRPSYKWDYKDGKINEAYFKVDYRSSAELGVSVAKYHNLYPDFKDLDKDSFLSALRSVIKEKDDEIEATIKICEIKTPIPEIPTAYFNVDVLAKIYSTGKAEIVLSNTGTGGFEVRNGCLRTIADSDRDVDLIVGGSSRAAMAVNFNLEAAAFRLMDVEADGGVRAAVSTTLHLYDEEGNMSSVRSNLPYSAVDEIARENSDVKICGDVSLNWLLDLYFNTSKTVLDKFSLWAKKTILDESDQVFGNKTHIENGTFMSSCTRKSRPRNKEKEDEQTDIEKIILEKYAAVIKVGESYQIPIKSLPEGYKKEDLVYESSKPEVAGVNAGTVKGISQGSSEISISTSDGRYNAALNILVSSG